MDERSVICEKQKSFRISLRVPKRMSDKNLSSLINQPL